MFKTLKLADYIGTGKNLYVVNVRTEKRPWIGEPHMSVGHAYSNDPISYNDTWLVAGDSKNDAIACVCLTYGLPVETVESPWWCDVCVVFETV
jgi:hypothetical protein